MRTKSIARGRFHGSSLTPLPPPSTDIISNGSDSSVTRIEFHSSTEIGDNVSHANDFSGDEEMCDFDKSTCLECNEGEQLLICCGIDCPIALHEKCISSEPKYDEGKFYCPYCWYKLLKARTEELRKKAMLARKDVDSFLKLRPEMACGDKEKRNNERAKGNDDEVHNGAREVEEDHQHISTEKVSCSDQSGGVDECVKISATHAREIRADEESMEQGKNDRMRDDDEKDEGTNVDEDCVETLNLLRVAEKSVVNDAFQGFPGFKSGTSNTSERDRVSMEKEEEINKDRPTADVSCASVDGDEPEASESETESFVVQLRHVKRIKSEKADSPKKLELHPHTTSTKATSNPVEEVERAEKLKQPEITAKKRIELPFAHEKRKRIHWKPEEEAALREGVHKFSNTANKNLPWRKILEFGRHIFDPSRNPTDLKDKWRNIMAKNS